MAQQQAAYVVAIDNGSQSTKVSIVDGAGRVHAAARMPLKAYVSSAPGRWEHPDDDIWHSIAAATSLALSRFDGDPALIAGVGLCTIRFCRAVLRADGSLAQPIMSWMDERLSRPYEQEVPDAAYVTTSSGYVTHRLTGEFRDTAGNYQGMWPIDAARWEWLPETETFGTPRDMLFELVQPGDTLGLVSEQASAATGLPAGIPVIATSNDKAVEALGAGLRGDGTALLSLGTYIAAMVPDARHRPVVATGWQNFASTPHGYLWESDGIRRGMWTVAWFRDLVAGFGGADSDAPLEQLLGAEAAAVPPGSGGLVTVLDWLAPADEPHRRGAFLGFDGTQGRAQLFRSILESIAFTMHDSVRRLEAERGRGVDELIVTGGGAASDMFMGVLASVFGVPVRRPELTDAAGMGAAICAAVGTGLHPDWDAAIDAMVRTDASFEPDPAEQAAYPEIERRHLTVVARAHTLFEDL
ncbi:sugar (pentulose or hexulose) kinase [Homoserinimonas aerilata]|uniref:Sugar (Pentulose or hexulose) kinase n=1 Tax=Homoserinimonas aerilata TaxID=1162970 RepID=A0A542Y1L7_9MICO|nr:FGGY-family carbohydrate kinase [Homoserinimonas aerilata]TQL41967.1 sugar (pentulose or hexulose) kinase [Homoserinimonas aerilata]